MVRKSKTDILTLLLTSTVQRRLKEAGPFGCKPRRKPRLTIHHKNARLDYACALKHWTVEKWSLVLFSDDSRFLIHKSDERV